MRESLISEGAEALVSVLPASNVKASFYELLPFKKEKDSKDKVLCCS